MTTKDRPSRRIRPLAALGAVGAAALTAMVLAGTGAAQGPPSTLHLMIKEQKGVGFRPKGAPSQGSRFGFGTKVSGDETGIQRELCTVIANGALCAEQLQLSKGTITAQGYLPPRPNDTPVAVTGGTGAYDGVRGTARVSKDRITIKLLP